MCSQVTVLLLAAVLTIATACSDYASCSYFDETTTESVATASSFDASSPTAAAVPSSVASIYQQTLTTVVSLIRDVSFSAATSQMTADTMQASSSQVQIPPSIFQQLSSSTAQKTYSWLVESESPSTVELSLTVDHTLVQQTSSPLVQQTSSPLVQQTSSPLVQQTSSPLVQQTSSPLVQQTSSPLVQQTSSPLVQQTSSPLVQQTSSPLVQQTSSPLVQQTPSPLVQQTSSPLVQQTSSPLVQQTSSPLVQQTSSPLVQQTSSPLVQQTSSPLVQQTSSPLVQQTSSPLVEQTSSPLVQQTPSPLVQQTPSPSPSMSSQNTAKSIPSVVSTGLLQTSPANRETLSSGNGNVVTQTPPQFASPAASSHMPPSLSRLAPSPSSPPLRVKSSSSYLGITPSPSLGLPTALVQTTQRTSSLRPQTATSGFSKTTPSSAGSSTLLTTPSAPPTLPPVPSIAVVLSLNSVVEIVANKKSQAVANLTCQLSNLLVIPHQFIKHMTLTGVAARTRRQTLFTFSTVSFVVTMAIENNTITRLVNQTLLIAGQRVTITSVRISLYSPNPVSLQGFDPGAIVGIVIGAAAGILLLVLVVTAISCYVWKEHTLRTYRIEMTETAPDMEDSKALEYKKETSTENNYYQLDVQTDRSSSERQSYTVHTTV